MNYCGRNSSEIRCMSSAAGNQSIVPGLPESQQLCCEEDLTRFNKIAIQGAPQMAVDKEAIRLSRVYSYYSKCNLPLFYV